MLTLSNRLIAIWPVRLQCAAGVDVVDAAEHLRQRAARNVDPHDELRVGDEQGRAVGREGLGAELEVVADVVVQHDGAGRGVDHHQPRREPDGDARAVGRPRDRRVVVGLAEAVDADLAAVGPAQRERLAAAVVIDRLEIAEARPDRGGLVEVAKMRDAVVGDAEPQHRPARVGEHRGPVIGPAHQGLTPDGHVALQKRLALARGRVDDPELGSRRGGDGEQEQHGQQDGARHRTPTHRHSVPES